MSKTTGSILVVGGAGFLGKEIIAALRAQGYERVMCFDQKPFSDQGVQSIVGDVLDAATCQKACQGMNTIINCIGQITSPINLCFQLNTRGVANIAAAAVQSSANVLHISTVAVYGTTPYADENSPVNPETPYATCKAFAEFLLQETLPEGQWTILRLSNLYGRTQPKGIIAYLLKARQHPEKLFFNNNGDMRRYYLNVQDCARCIVQIVEEPAMHGIFNLLGNEQYSIKELLHEIEQTAGLHFEVRYEDVPPLENALVIDDAKIRNYFTPAYTTRVRDLFQNPAHNTL